MGSESVGSSGGVGGRDKGAGYLACTICHSSESPTDTTDHVLVDAEGSWVLAQTLL